MFQKAISVLVRKLMTIPTFLFLKRKLRCFYRKVGLLSLTQEEIEKLKERREREIDASLVKLNNDIYQNEKGLGENDRVYLVAASIMATLGDVEHNVYPLKNLI